VHIANDLRELHDPQSCIKSITTGAGPVFSTHIGIATVQGIDLVGVMVVPDFQKKNISTVDITSQGGQLSLAEKTSQLTFRGKNYQTQSSREAAPYGRIGKRRIYEHRYGVA